MVQDIKEICNNCIEEKYLQKQIIDNNQINKCSYCAKSDKFIKISNLADIIDHAFKVNYNKLTDNTDIIKSLKNENEEPITLNGNPAKEAIAQAALIPEDAAEDIRIILEEKYNQSDSLLNIFEDPDYAASTHYIEKIPDGKIYTQEWKQLERIVKQENRYFNKEIEKHLDDIFNNIESITSNNSESIFKLFGPGTDKCELYRARLFQSDDELKVALKKPDFYLGPPPHSKARGGRMNADGISVFYGADSMESAIAEVRPLVGSKVAVASFAIMRPLKLLNTLFIDNLIIHGSIFDSEKNYDRERIAFLKNLCKKMVVPVLPDNEKIEYLITQVIADYLSLKEDIDGIIYSSVQYKNGYNVVLFNKSTKNEIDNSYTEDEMSVYQSDGGYIIKKDKVKSNPFGTIGDLFKFSETTKPSLKINLKTINVIEINSISFDKNLYKVDYI